MFDENDIESWCTVCDRQIKAAPPTPASSSSTGPRKPPQTGTVAPGKYIAPKAPTFKRSKTGTIRAKPPTTTTVPSAEPQRPPGVQRSSSGTIKRTSSAGQVPDQPAGPAATDSQATDSTPSTPTPTNPRSPPKIKTTSLPVVPSYNSGLFCSYECARLEEERSSTVIAPLLSSQLSFGASTSPLQNSWTASSQDEPPSPFYLSTNGSDSESGEYFIDHGRLSSSSARAGAEERERATRRGSRSTNCTTGSSSDSLASLWDGVDAGAGHPYHGLRRMTPLKGKPDVGQLLGGPGGLLAGEPIPIRPISAQSLIPPPPITSPSPHNNSHTSSNSYSRRASSTSYTSANQSRSSSHSHAHSASAHLNPSSYSMSPPPFEPGSAPSTASLYASYAQSFQRTPSVESRLAMYGGPRAMGASASPRRGRLNLGEEDGVYGSQGSKTTGLSASYTSSKRSTSVASSNSSVSVNGGQQQKTTPTQPHHLHRPSLPSASLPSSRRPSTSTHHVISTSPLEHSLSTQSLTRPPPSKARLANSAEKAPASVGTNSWNWSAMEKMYEIPTLAKTKTEGDAGRVVGGVGSGGKLFYWGAD